MGMSRRLYIILIIAGITGVFSNKLQNIQSSEESKNIWSLKERIEQLRREEAELKNEVSSPPIKEEQEDEKEAMLVDDVIDFPSFTPQELTNEEDEIEDPCESIYCKAGQECIITPKGKGVCRCIEKCEGVQDERRKVCSNHNETWPSDCELYRMRCICLEGHKGCSKDDFKHLHIDYYGSCQEVSECEEAELKDFPRRMREWLFNVLTDMADRNSLDQPSMEIKKKTDQDPNFRWVGAAIWKWCQLDSHPKDKSVSRHEIFPVRAPLHTLEHCISPFLDSCDSNNDHHITLKEWVTCLQLSQNMTDDMEDLCDDIRG